MLTSCFDSAALRWSAVLLAIVGLSPVPLGLPSGVALGVIGLVGAAVLVFRAQQPASVTARIAPLGNDLKDLVGGRLRHESGARI
jgi:hypothetical protein